MAFITDKEEVKRGVIIFRRSDVKHRDWYCRVKLPKVDRYKIVSLKTADIALARHLAGETEVEIRTTLKLDHPVFNRPFREVAADYLATQEARAKRGEISGPRIAKLKAVIEGPLDEYVGSTQVHRIGQESWDGYPTWRRETGAGRNLRNGVREVSPELARTLAKKHADAQEKSRTTRGFGPRKPPPPAPPPEDGKPILVAMVSDSTIRFEMSIFGAVMNYSIKKKYTPASQRFDDRPKLKVMRRDEFTLEEYRKLHNFALHKWMKKVDTTGGLFYREMAYNFMLIMTNTGMRPSEAKNLRWRDIMPAKDRDGRDIVVLFVQGKGKSRKLVAPASVGEYLDRIRKIYRRHGSPDEDGKTLIVGDPRPTDPVFSTVDGKPAKSLYQAPIEDLLTKAGLRDGPNGVPRSTYCFRHTYATFRLSEGVDVYFLAEQMGTSVKMIQDHYGHVNTIKHADRVLQGMGGWDPVEAPAGDAQEDSAKEGDAKAAKAVAAKQAAKPRRRRVKP
jgi:integrase